MDAPGPGRKLMYATTSAVVGVVLFVVAMVAWMQIGNHVFDLSEPEVSDSPGYGVLPAIFGALVASLTYGWLDRRWRRRANRSDS